MKYSDIQGLTPAQIQSKFALPNTPTHYCYVNVPAVAQGTVLCVGALSQETVLLSPPTLTADTVSSP